MCEDSPCPPARRMIDRRGVLRAGALAVGGLAGVSLGIGPLSAVPAPAAATARMARVLVYSRTTGFRHYSIEIGVATIQQLGMENGFTVEATEDPSVFTDRNLSRFTAVVFLNTTAEVMTPAGRKALRRYVLGGGGWVGVHSAADTEYDWPFYERLLAGGRFLCHPLQQPGVVVREATRHRSTRHLPERWQLPFEEFYSFKANPRDRAKVLLSIDESTYQQDPNTSHLPTADFPDQPEPVTGVMGDHPMSWVHRVGDGIAWYTALGHEGWLYLDPSYRQHLLGGILTASLHGQRR